MFIKRQPEAAAPVSADVWARDTPASLCTPRRGSQVLTQFILCSAVGCPSCGADDMWTQLLPSNGSGFTNTLRLLNHTAIATTAACDDGQAATPQGAVDDIATERRKWASLMSRC